MTKPINSDTLPSFNTMHQNAPTKSNIPLFIKYFLVLTGTSLLATRVMRTFSTSKNLDLYAVGATSCAFLTYKLWQLRKAERDLKDAVTNSLKEQMELRELHRKLLADLSGLKESQLRHEELMKKVDKLEDKKD